MAVFDTGPFALPLEYIHFATGYMIIERKNDYITYLGPLVRIQTTIQCCDISLEWNRRSIDDQSKEAEFKVFTQMDQAFSWAMISSQSIYLIH